MATSRDPDFRGNIVAIMDTPLQQIVNVHWGKAVLVLDLDWQDQMYADLFGAQTKFGLIVDAEMVGGGIRRIWPNDADMGAIDESDFNTRITFFQRGTDPDKPTSELGDFDPTRPQGRGLVRQWEPDDDGNNDGTGDSADHATRTVRPEAIRGRFMYEDHSSDQISTGNYGGGVDLELDPLSFAAGSSQIQDSYRVGQFFLMGRSHGSFILDPRKLELDLNAGAPGGPQIAALVISLYRFRTDAWRENALFGSVAGEGGDTDRLLRTSLTQAINGDPDGQIGYIGGGDIFSSSSDSWNRFSGMTDGSLPRFIPLQTTTDNQMIWGINNTNASGASECDHVVVESIVHDTSAPSGSFSDITCEAGAEFAPPPDGHGRLLAVDIPGADPPLPQIIVVDGTYIGLAAGTDYMYHETIYTNPDPQPAVVPNFRASECMLKLISGSIIYDPTTGATPSIRYVEQAGRLRAVGGISDTKPLGSDPSFQQRFRIKWNQSDRRNPIGAEHISALSPDFGSDSTTSGRFSGKFRWNIRKSGNQATIEFLSPQSS